MKLSIVTTLYQSEPYVVEFVQRAEAAAKALVGDQYEIVLVNDGSPDNSLELAVGLCEQNRHMIVVDLSRNFGHHRAMMTGLAHAKGELVFLIDSDLEEEPEWLSKFEEQMVQEQCDVVYGVQAARKGGAFERSTGAAFYKLFRKLTGINQPDNIVTARIMTQRFVQALISHQERELNIGGLWIITGFKQASQLIRKKSTSPTSYTLSGKISHLVNAITSFSSLPLVYTFYSGLFIAITALFYIAYLFLRFFLIASPPSGYPNAITLRTSIIGHELDSASSLIGWFLSQEGSVKGYKRAIFSGLPTVEVARVIRDHVIPHSELHGVYHVSAEPINKFDLLTLVAQAHRKKIDINPDYELVIDRSLDSTRFREATGFTPKLWPELIRSMRDFG